MENSKDAIFGHKPALFVLFFTEMWERFSYYGMRALLVLFLVSEAATGGWEWTSAEALTLYGTYTMWVYITPILGGLLADKYLGFRWAVIIGALLMTLGHASMALETSFFFYLGLALLVIGNGFFKPNISSMVGQLYGPDEAAKKDGGYTIFYMGINAGAFLGILLCGYIGEKVGWSYGFGLAGIFMFFGMVMFWFGQGIFGKIGDRPKRGAESLTETLEDVDAEEEERQEILATYDHAALDTRVSNEAPDLEPGRAERLKNYIRDKFARKVTVDRLIVVFFFSLFSVFFWMCFEQAGGTMNLFAKNFTQRVLTGGSAVAFRWIDAILTIVPMIIVSYVLIKLFSKTFKRFALSNLFLGCSFVIIWALCIWKVYREFDTQTYEVNYTHEVTESIQDTLTGSDATTLMLSNGEYNVDGYLADNYSNGVPTFIGFNDIAVNKYEDGFIVSGSYNMDLTETGNLRVNKQLEDGESFNAIISDSKLRYLEEGTEGDYKSAFGGEVVRQLKDETEVTASWFQILNSLFIVLFAPVFSRFWEKKWNPSGPVKFAMGMIMLGIGFGFLAMGSMSIPQGAEVAGVSMIWLVFAFLFHTWGELCISPVGLSFVSKLSPKKLVGLMFGVWFFASAMGNKLAGTTGAMMEEVSEQLSLAKFFSLYVAIPVAIALLILLMRKWLVKKMHGIN